MSSTLVEGAVVVGLGKIALGTDDVKSRMGIPSWQKGENSRVYCCPCVAGEIPKAL